MSNSLSGSTVLVTGGAGLIGSHIVDQLCQENVAEIRVLDNLVRGSWGNLLNSAGSQTTVQLLEGDIRDRRIVGEAMAGCDYVFHQAAIRITLCAEMPRECIDVLVNGTFNVFEAAVCERVRKVVYASSASVYGAADTFPTSESHHPFNNRTIYGAAKVMNEGLARSFQEMYGLPSIGLRYFNVYGPRMDVTGLYTEVFVRWLECAERGIPPEIHGDGSATMDFVFVEDIARANILAMQSSHTDEVYNIASGVETSLAELWQAVSEVSEVPGLRPIFKPPRNVNAVPRRLADINKAREHLGFEAKTSLRAGLQRLAHWRKGWTQSLAHATAQDES
jgi:UDP-glucose 4-epimerase